MSAPEALPVPRTRKSSSKKRIANPRQASNPFLLLQGNVAPSAAALLPASTSISELSLEDAQWDDGTVRFKSKTRPVLPATDDVPFPSSSSTEHLSTLKASLRTRLDSDSRERERTASLRSRKGSDASSLRSTSGAGTANKLRKRRPSASKVVLDASWQAVGEDVDESLTQSDPLDASFSSTFDKRASLSSTVDSSLLQSSPPPEREVEADRSIDEPREDPSETPAPRTASKPPTLFANYLSFSMRIHYVLSWPLYGFLSALAAIPLVRLFVPRLEDRPSLSQILSLSVEGHPSSPRQKQRALRWDSQDGGETGA